MLKIILPLCFCSLFLTACTGLTNQTTLPINSDFSTGSNDTTKIFTTTGPPQIEDKSGYFLLPVVNFSI